MRRLAGGLLNFYRDPLRRAANEQAACMLDPLGWPVSSACHVLLAARLWLADRGAGLVLALLSYSVLCMCMAAVLHWRRALYIKHRELLGAVTSAHHTAVWLHVVMQGGIPLFSLHAGRPLRLLALLAMANSSIWVMLTFTYARCTVSAMRRILPLLALQQLARSVPLCRCLLREHGADAPMQQLYHTLAVAHEAALLPFASPAAVASPGPLHACLAVNAWLVLAVSVVLPLALLRLLEQRFQAAREAARVRQAGWQQNRAADAPATQEEITVVAWPMRAYLSSSLVWCAVGLCMNVWRAAAPASLPSAA